MSLSTTINYDSSGQFSFPATITVSSTATLTNSSGYAITNPAIKTQYSVIVSALTGFSASVSASGGDAVQYQLLVNGVCYWYDTINVLWTTATLGTYSQSNTAAQLNSNVSTLVSALALSGNVYISPVALLHSNNGSTTPTLTSVTVTYSFANSSVAAISTNTISLYLKDILANVPTYNSQQPSVLYVKSDKAFLHSNRLILPFCKTANFDSTGFVSLAVIETATPGYPLQFGISYYEGLSRKEIKFRPAIVPNSASSSLNAITVIDTIDFG